MQGFNKYYPPDYDPNKHTSLNAYRGKHALGDRARKLDQGILITRFELPFNIWCGGCNNHIGMGVRYNAEKKKIGNYYSTPIFQFRCKCHLCDNWFTVETDPKNTRYVVTSGARQKDEEWNPEENGGYAIHDPSSSSTPADPLATLEKSTTAQKHMTEVVLPRIDELLTYSSKYTADPYTLSTKVRKRFRVEKKIELRKKEADERLKGRYGLPEGMELVGESEEMREEARGEFERGRREWVGEEERRRRRFVAEFGPLRAIPPAAASSAPAKSSSSLPDRTKKTGAAALPSTAKAAGAKSMLQAKLLQTSARHLDLPSAIRSKPPDARGLGIVLKK